MNPKLHSAAPAMIPRILRNIFFLRKSEFTFMRAIVRSYRALRAMGIFPDTRSAYQLVHRFIFGVRNVSVGHCFACVGDKLIKYSNADRGAQVPNGE
jgi:hypothetical protein